MTDASPRFLIVRLSPFRDVERSTPHQFLFREVKAALPGACIDFDFFPSVHHGNTARPGDIQPRRGLATGCAVADFDVVLLSNSYTLELVNLVPWLVASGIPVTRSEREQAMAESDKRFPLLILGGSNALASASVYDEASGDSMVDAIFFGEGEGSVGRMAAALAECSRYRGQRRLDLLLEIASAVKGFWPTARHQPVFQSKAEADAFPVGAPPQLPGEEAGTIRLEITRGCPSFCSFCFEGWERKPYRERSVESILAEARNLKALTGADAVELASYNFNAHSRIVDIIKGLNRIFNTVSFQSQRVDMLARSPGLVRFEVAAGKRSFTVGVEGLSARMRAYYNKELEEADIRTVLAAMVREGAREIKLFYILSCYEDDADIVEFSAFMAWLDTTLRTQPPAARPRIILSAGELVRMPFTPLAYEALLLDEAPYAAISSRLREITARFGFEYRSPGHFDEYCLSQVLALSPPGSMELLAIMARQGFLYDRNLSRGAWAFARGWLESHGVLDETFLGRKARDHNFAYGFITPLASRDMVYQRWVEASSCLKPRSCKERRSCLGASCVACGACDEAERGFIESHELDGVSQDDLRDIESLMSAKRKPYRLNVQATLTREAAAYHPAYASALFRRQLYASIPALADITWTAEDAFLQSREGLERLPGAWGDTVYTVFSSSPIDPELLGTAGFKVTSDLPQPQLLCVQIDFPGASLAMIIKLVADFLNAAAIPHTLRKKEAGATMEISEKGRKKKNVLKAELSLSTSYNPDTERNQLVHGILDCGSKYDLSILAALANKRSIVFELNVSCRSCTKIHTVV